MELPIIDVTEKRPGQRPVWSSPVDGERGIALSVDAPDDPVRAQTRDPGVMVDGVGIITLELACGRNDRRKSGVVGVGLKEQLGRRREQLSDIPVALNDVEGVSESLVAEDVAIPNELKGADQLIEYRSGLGSLVHFARGPSFVPTWVRINKSASPYFIGG